MKVKLELTMGVNTCRIENLSEPFCRFCYAKRFGTKPWCHLFEEEIFDKDGRLQRIPKCLKELK